MSNATESFFSAWSIAASNSRLEAIENAVSANISYADPRTPAALTSSVAVADYVGAFAHAAPGATAKVIKSDETLGMQRATIAFTMVNGIVQHGQYFITFDDDGKINRITGFVGTGEAE